MSIFLHLLKLGIYAESKQAQDDLAYIRQMIGYQNIEGLPSINLSIDSLSLKVTTWRGIIYMVNGFQLCARDEFDDAQNSGKIWTPDTAYRTTVTGTPYVIFFRTMDSKQQIEVVPIKQNEQCRWVFPDASELKHCDMRSLCISEPRKTACVLYRLMGYKDATTFLENMFPQVITVSRIKNRIANIYKEKKKN